jgi:HEAT repeat protein
MAQYPFEQKFRDLVEKHHAPGDPIGPWDLLIIYEAPGAQLYKALIAEGYSIETVSTQIKELKALPVADLIELALTDKLEHSPALLVLQQSNSRDVLDAIIELTVSSQADERKLAALVLMRAPGRTFEKEAIAAIKAMMATEKDEQVIGALAFAVKHLDINDSSEFLNQVAQSKERENRYAAAFALGGRNEDALAIKTLITLSQDTDDDLRDWATFGLYLATQHKQPVRAEIKEALFARIDDSHDETRYQAIAGLGSCKDPRVLEQLIKALEADDVWHLVIKAARELGHPALYPTLIKLQEDFPSDKLVAQAISACTAKSAK